MRKWAFACLCALLCLPAMMTKAGAISARAAVVIDADTGAVLFEQNKDECLPMASTTKIMTALVVLSEGGLSRSYEVRPEYAGVEGSSMYLRAGEHLTIAQTLYGLLLVSGNDAAEALAGEYGGMAAFVQKMNDKAAELGLTQTHFENPHGLPSDTHHTTAHELAIITAEALRDPLFRQIVSTGSYSMDGRSLQNHNRLLREYEGAIGVKTGFTKEAGRCLVSAAERNGRTLIAVTLNDPDDWRDHKQLLDEGFAQYSERALHRAGDTLFTLTVQGGTENKVDLYAERDCTAFLRQDEQVQTLRYGQAICYAPVVQGGAAGAIEYRIGGRVLARDGLRYGGSVPLDTPKKSLLERIIDSIRGRA